MAVLLATPMLGLSSPVVGAPSEHGQPDCTDPEWIEGVGRACVLSDGLLQLIDPDTGEVTGYTHGIDEVNATEGASTEASVTTAPVECNSASYGEAGEYFAKVFYAFASDDTDRYSAVADELRSLTEKGNGFVATAGDATGTPARLVVQCASGEITVERVALPGTKARYETLGNIMDDLADMGWDDGTVKHWVFYDHLKDSGLCRGLGHIYDDDSLSESNLNNGNGVAMFAVQEGCLPGEGWGDGVARLWVHELSHNMGAVQSSAPHSSSDNGGGRHCTDGEDVMCPASRSWATLVCADLVYDCNKDDYFDTTPESGTYLADHWNIGSDLNRFVFLGELDTTAPSKVTGLHATSVGQTTVRLNWDQASDDRELDHYNVYRGTPSTSPSQLGASASTSFHDSGLEPDTTYVYEVSAVDAAGNEGPRSDPIEVTTVLDGDPPRLTVQQPAAGWTYVNGCSARTPTVGGPVFLERGCVELSARDDLATDAGIVSITVRLSGAESGQIRTQVVVHETYDPPRPSVDLTASFVFDRSDPLSEQALNDGYRLSVTVTDEAGRSTAVTVRDITAIAS